MAPLNSEDDFLSSVASEDDVKARINKRYDALYNPDRKDKLVPLVCSVCDELILERRDLDVISIKKMKDAREMLSWERNVDNENRIKAIEEVYQFPEEVPGEKDEGWLKDMCLSPRGSLYRRHANKKLGFSSCVRCKILVDKKKMPLEAIVNKNYVGCAPSVLKELNQVELAFLSPVKKYGYVFRLQACEMKGMNGSMMFMRVKEESTARSVSILESMGLTKHVVVMVTGKFTKEQKQKARQQTEVRTDKLIAAVKWLCQNHAKWKDIDYETVKNEVTKNSKPILVEKSRTVLTTNATVSDDIVWTCYYPDGSTNTQKGGFDDPRLFKEFVDEMKKKNYDIEMKAQLEQKFVQERDGDQLMGAGLLQFPYGVCGMDDNRELPDGLLSSRWDLSEYLRHLSKKADPVFQEAMFQLLMYSQKSKSRLFRSARLQLKNKVTAATLAKGFDVKDFSKACAARHAKRGPAYRRGSRVSNTLLDAVDATARDLPHTRGAAKKGRSSMESMHHHLGMGSVFLTVTWDDNNSLLIQVLADEDIDGDKEVDDSTDKELKVRSKRREKVRLEFPGLGALNFEMMMDILMEEVLCWDMDNHEAIKGKKGLFGNIEGMAYAVEEQGRRTLHTHFILWVKGYMSIQKDLFFGGYVEKEEATTTIRRYYDHVACTSLFPSSKRELLCVFDHECSVKDKRDRDTLVVVDDQRLRYMRHKEGKDAFGKDFAHCPHCGKAWTYEEMLTQYIEEFKGVRDKVTPIPDGTTILGREPNEPRLWGKVLEYQRPGNTEEPTECINVVYQAHSSNHSKYCFKCEKLTGKQKKNHKHDKNCECRYRLPDRGRDFTAIKTHDEGAKWFEWTGNEIKQPIVSFLPKRNQYDLFQNVSCPAISNSKFTCNSNVKPITDGPTGMYCCKYVTKDTTDDDTTEYAHVDKVMKKSGEPKHPNDDKKEAMRLMSRAAFAHNKQNIISASMAAFLIRNDSRFYFSHKFVFCPLKDVVRLHNHQDITGNLAVTHTGKSFFENQALHYLCRPESLDNVCLKDFTERYEVCYCSKKNLECKDNPAERMQVTTGAFSHPSGKQRGKKKDAPLQCYQGVRLRQETLLAKVPQWNFPDTGNFHASIVGCSDDDVNREMETYAQLVLTLLMPHRSSKDLEAYHEEYPYAMMLRKVYTDDEEARKRGDEMTVFTVDNMCFLQNIQNARHNSLRYKYSSDDLAENTKPYVTESDHIHLDDEEEEDKPVAEEDCMGYEDLMENLEMDMETDIYDKDPELLFGMMQNLKFQNIRNKGSKKCGHRRDLDLPHVQEQREGFFVEMTEADYNAQNSETRKRKRDDERRAKYGVKELTAILLMKTTKQRRDVWKGKDIDVGEATGTITSIREWSKSGFGRDKKQQRAFEVIISAFLLTFFDDEDHDMDSAADTMLERGHYRRNKNGLRKLKGGNDDQLIMLLHGPGGSGKSTVINMVIAYAKSFCELLGHEFTSKTIVVTAMSGVAATLLNGETTHRALYLRRNAVPQNALEEWFDTRLVMVDEISFAGCPDFVKMYVRLCTLLQDMYKAYGGGNLLLSGDYSQLEPVKCPLLVHMNHCWQFHDNINAFIELDGKHRFKDDPAWGQRLYRFRSGVPTRQDIIKINDECHVRNKKPPRHIQIATYYNKNRDAINTAIFEDWCAQAKPDDGSLLPHAVLIFMDNLEMTNSSKAFVPVDSNRVKRYFYENCGEDDCNVPNGQPGRCDPILKLYPNCPMMLVDNQNVQNGQANGSRVRVKKITVVPGEASSTLKLDCGATVRVIMASQVQNIEVEHENDKIIPRTFPVCSRSWRFTTKLELDEETLHVSMKANQFPLISNSCTTGHKLQGCSMDEILVNDWNYRQNWTYVVLSRVRTMKGLYLREPLSLDLTKYALKPEIVAMLKKFERDHAVQPMSADEYKTIIKNTENHD